LAAISALNGKQVFDKVLQMQLQSEYLAKNAQPVAPKEEKKESIVKDMANLKISTGEKEAGPTGPKQVRVRGESLERRAIPNNN
jgi:hypothetical protein